MERIHEALVRDALAERERLVQAERLARASQVHVTRGRPGGPSVAGPRAGPAPVPHRQATGPCVPGRSPIQRL
jgi:hypothetical protein